MAKYTFYMTRHGETDYNKQGIWQGCLLNPKLNDNGREQAKQLDYIMEKNDVIISKIESSPLRRALETAKIIQTQNTYRHNGIEVTTFDINYDLIEGDFGIADGKKEDYLATEHFIEYRKWKDLENLHFHFENGESKYEIGERMYYAITNDISGLDCKLFVTHSASIRCFLLYIGEHYDEIPFGNIYEFELEYKNNEIKINLVRIIK